MIVHGCAKILKMGQRLDQRGFAALTVMLVSDILLLIVMLVSEYLYMHTVKMRFEDEICQALRSATEAATSDIYRADGVVSITPQHAAADFLMRLYANAGLNDAGSCIAEGRTVYRYVQEDVTIGKDYIQAQGTLFVRPLFMGEAFNVETDIKVSGRVKQIRTD